MERQVGRRSGFSDGESNRHNHGGWNLQGEVRQQQRPLAAEGGGLDGDFRWRGPDVGADDDDDDGVFHELQPRNDENWGRDLAAGEVFATRRMQRLHGRSRHRRRRPTLSLVQRGNLDRRTGTPYPNPRRCQSRYNDLFRGGRRLARREWKLRRNAVWHGPDENEEEPVRCDSAAVPVGNTSDDIGALGSTRGERKSGGLAPRFSCAPEDDDSAKDTALADQVGIDGKIGTATALFTSPRRSAVGSHSCRREREKKKGSRFREPKSKRKKNDGRRRRREEETDQHPQELPHLVTLCREKRWGEVRSWLERRSEAEEQINRAKRVTTDRRHQNNPQDSSGRNRRLEFLHYYDPRNPTLPFWACVHPRYRDECATGEWYCDKFGSRVRYGSSRTDEGRKSRGNKDRPSKRPGRRGSSDQQGKSEGSVSFRKRKRRHILANSLSSQGQRMSPARPASSTTLPSRLATMSPSTFGSDGRSPHAAMIHIGDHQGLAGETETTATIPSCAGIWNEEEERCDDTNTQKRLVGCLFRSQCSSSSPCSSGSGDEDESYDDKYLSSSCDSLDPWGTERVPGEPNDDDEDHFDNWDFPPWPQLPVNGKNQLSAGADSTASERNGEEGSSGGEEKATSTSRDASFPPVVTGADVVDRRMEGQEVLLFHSRGQEGTNSDRTIPPPMPPSHGIHPSGLTTRSSSPSCGASIRQLCEARERRRLVRNAEADSPRSHHFGTRQTAVSPRLRIFQRSPSDGSDALSRSSDCLRKPCRCRTALSYACLNLAPLDVIRALYQTCPSQLPHKYTYNTRSEDDGDDANQGDVPAAWHPRYNPNPSHSREAAAGTVLHEMIPLHDKWNTLEFIPSRNDAENWVSFAEAVDSAIRRVFPCQNISNPSPTATSAGTSEGSEAVPSLSFVPGFVSGNDGIDQKMGSVASSREATPWGASVAGVARSRPYADGIGKMGSVAVQMGTSTNIDAPSEGKGGRDGRHLHSKHEVTTTDPVDILAFLVLSDREASAPSAEGKAAPSGHVAASSVLDERGRTPLQLWVDQVFPLLVSGLPSVLPPPRTTEVAAMHGVQYAESGRDADHHSGHPSLEQRISVHQAIDLRIQHSADRWIRSVLCNLVMACSSAIGLTDRNGRTPLIAVSKWILRDESSALPEHIRSVLQSEERRISDVPSDLDAFHERDEDNCTDLANPSSSRDRSRRSSVESSNLASSLSGTDEGPSGFCMTQARYLARVIEVMVRANPLALRVTCSSFGNTPIHYAILLRKPYIVLHSLMEGASRVKRDGVENHGSATTAVLPHCTLVANKVGELPIHMALELEAPPKILHLLLNSGQDPELTRTMARAVDRGGRCAIHWAWIRHLCESQCGYGSISRVDDGDGDGDWSPIRRMARRSLPSDFEEGQKRYLELLDSLCGRPIELRSVLGHFLETMETLLMAAYHGMVSSALLPHDTKWSLVHAASAVPCPRAVLRIALMLHPEQALERDDQGQIPLHTALTAGLRGAANYSPTVSRCESSFASSTGLWRPDAGELSVVQTLVSAVPAATQISAPTGMRGLPLHMAIQRVLQLSHAIKTNDKKFSLWARCTAGTWREDARQIMRASPGALGIRECQSMLYPFMQAACGPLGSLTLAYELLLQAPEMVKVGCDSSNDTK